MRRKPIAPPTTSQNLCPQGPVAPNRASCDLANRSMGCETIAAGGARGQSGRRCCHTTLRKPIAKTGPFSRLGTSTSGPTKLGTRTRARHAPEGDGTTGATAPPANPEMIPATHSWRTRDTQESGNTGINNMRRHTPWMTHETAGTKNEQQHNTPPKTHVAFLGCCGMEMGHRTWACRVGPTASAKKAEYGQSRNESGSSVQPGHYGKPRYRCTHSCIMQRVATSID